MFSKLDLADHAARLSLARWAALILFGAGLVMGCAPKDSGDSYVTDCELPSDQSATLAGHWSVRAVPVAFHSGDWNSQEQSAISAAASTWNNFYSVTTNSSMIEITGTSNETKPASICSQTILSGSEYIAPVVIYKDTTWPYSSMPNVIALTTFCPTPAKPLNNFYMAIVEVNYQNFFTSGHKIPDLQSILTHEFGHVAGLKHSCESTASTGMPACSSASSDYTSAIMAPIFTFDQYGYGEVKQALTSNDEGRANCLYQ